MMRRARPIDPTPPQPARPPPSPHRQKSYTLGQDGQRLFCAHYDAADGRHVVECNGMPAYTTEHYPYFVNEDKCGRKVLLEASILPSGCFLTLWD